MQRINRLIGEMTENEGIAIFESIEDDSNLFAVTQFIAASIFVQQGNQS